MINSYIAEGKLVPGAVTVELIKAAMEKNGWDKKKYLVDGFPRSDENLQGWNAVMKDDVVVKTVLFLEVDEVS